MTDCCILYLSFVSVLFEFVHFKLILNIEWQHVAPVTLNVCFVLSFTLPGLVDTTGNMLLMSPYIFGFYA